MTLDIVHFSIGFAVSSMPPRLTRRGGVEQLVPPDAQRRPPRDAGREFRPRSRDRRPMPPRRWRAELRFEPSAVVARAAGSAASPALARHTPWRVHKKTLSSSIDIASRPLSPLLRRPPGASGRFRKGQKRTPNHRTTEHFR